LKKYKLPDSDHIPEEMIQADETLQSEIHKLVNSVWNEGELLHQWQYPPFKVKCGDPK
jgi:hypothetical protein